MRLLRSLRSMLALGTLVAIGSPAKAADKVKDPRASLFDVASRRAALQASTDPVVRAAVTGLPSCVKLAAVPAPVGEMVIPKHYLQDSHGPTNPAEAEATRVYGAFARRVTAGMNRWVATGDEAEAGCALDQMAGWAQAKTLLNYDRQESPQAYYQVEWTASSAGITASVLAQDAALDPAKMRLVEVWLDAVVRRNLSFEKDTDTKNNHHYWKGLAATAVGVTAGDNKLFQFGVDTYREAIRDISPDGSFPKEMARHERALHYQIFAIDPLVLTAEFAARQGVDLYGYSAHGRTLKDAIVFFGRALADPELIRKYASEDQDMGFGPSTFAPIVFYAARFWCGGAAYAADHGDCAAVQRHESGAEARPCWPARTWKPGHSLRG